jgi:DNA polymerase-4
MGEATADTHAILQIAAALLRASGPLIERRGLTLVGISLTNLVDRGAIQLVLPFEKARELDRTLDEVRDRYGSSAITRGVLVGRDPGIAMPMLPD